MSVIRVRKPLSSAAAAAGGSCSQSVVKPTMSQNITVTSRSCACMPLSASVACRMRLTTDGEWYRCSRSRRRVSSSSWLDRRACSIATAAALASAVNASRSADPKRALFELST